MNLEVEAKVGEDLIKLKNKYEETAEYNEPIIYNDTISPEYYEGLEDGIIVIAPKNGEEAQQVLINENFNSSIGDKIFMGSDFKDKYIEDLYKRYLSMIKQVAERRKFITGDREIYNKIGASLPQEKSNHDTRPFDDSISPEYLLHILKK